MEELLKGLEKTKKEYWNISRETAEFLRFLVKISKSNNILEIGTSNGYSTIFLALAVKENKGKVITIESWSERAKKALANFKKVNLTKNIELKEGNALEILDKIDEKFDFVFIDAKKKDYIDYVKKIENKLNENFVIVADNAISHKEKIKEYYDYVMKKYDSFLLKLGSGLLISVKR